MSKQAVVVQLVSMVSAIFILVTLPFQEQFGSRLGAVHHWTSVLPSLLQVPVLSGGVPLETC